MKFLIDRKFANRIISLTWEEVRYFTSKGLMAKEVAVDKALNALKSDHYTEDELELAALDPADTLGIESKLESITNLPKNLHNLRWVKIALAWLYENQDQVEDPLLTLGELYADFGYLEEISHLVFYMPNESGSKDLMEEWKIFLYKEVYSKIIKQKET